jgi:uncharacterized protein (TIRG00374 family)
MLRRRLLNVFKVAFGVGMLAYIARDVHGAQLMALARKGNPAHLWAGVGCMLVAMMYFQWTRLHVLIKGFTNGIATSLKIFYVGALFNNLLPSNIGGDAIRLIYLKNLRTENWGTPFMLLLLHRLSGFVVLVLAGLVYVGLEHTRLLSLLEARHLLLQLSARTWLLGGAGLLLVAVLGLFAVRRLSDRVRERVLGFGRNCRGAFTVVSGKDFTWLMVHTFLFHGLRMLSFYYLVRYLGQQVSMWDLVFVISATAVAAVLPVTVAGLGVVEGSISGLLAMYGVADSSAVAVALVNRLVLLLMAAIGGIVYAATRDERAQRVPHLEPSA